MCVNTGILTLTYRNLEIVWLLVVLHSLWAKNSTFQRHLEQYLEMCAHKCLKIFVNNVVFIVENIKLGYHLKSVRRLKRWINSSKHTLLLKRPRVIPNIHAKWLPNTCNSSGRTSDTFFWPLWAIALTCT